MRSAFILFCLISVARAVTFYPIPQAMDGSFNPAGGGWGITTQHGGYELFNHTVHIAGQVIYTTPFGVNSGEQFAVQLTGITCPLTQKYAFSLGYTKGLSIADGMLVSYCRPESDTYGLPENAVFEYIHKDGSAPTTVLAQNIVANGEIQVSGWYPGFTDQTVSFTPNIGSGCATPFTTSTSYGRKIQIGSNLYFTINVVWTSKASASGNSLLVVTLPATISSSSSYNRVTFALGRVAGVTWTGNLLTASADAGTDVIYFYNSFGSGAYPTPVLVSDCLSSGELTVTGWIPV